MSFAKKKMLRCSKKFVTLQIKNLSTSSRHFIVSEDFILNSSARSYSQSRKTKYQMDTICGLVVTNAVFLGELKSVAPLSRAADHATIIKNRVKKKLQMQHRNYMPNIKCRYAKKAELVLLNSNCNFL